ncbi:MAG: hypothetical protein JXA44_01125 [Methanospirillaceae archaeon]|nr:hypothetical protein [Methanospirillaceae archaeon]
MKKPDEIMAEFLLKGGKMLASSCSVCGSPLFLYKGETLCVVCDEKKNAESDTLTRENNKSFIRESQKSGVHKTSSSGTSDPKTPGSTERPGEEVVLPSELAFAISATISDLLERISHEQDTRRVLDLMQAVRDGAQALSCLGSNRVL